MCKQCKPGEGSKLRVTLGQVGRRSILPLVAHSSFLPCFTRQGETQSCAQSVKGKSHVTYERSAPTVSLDLISAIASEASYEATFAPFRPPPQFHGGLWPKSHAAVAVRRININSIQDFNQPPTSGWRLRVRNSITPASFVLAPSSCRSSTTSTRKCTN